MQYLPQRFQRLVYPRSARADIFIQQDVLVSGGGKGCISHLKNNHLQAGNEVKTSKLRKVSSVINQSEITVLLRDLRERILEGFSKKLYFRETLNNLTVFRMISLKIRLIVIF